MSGNGTYTFRAGSLDQTSGGQLVTAVPDHQAPVGRPGARAGSTDDVGPVLAARHDHGRAHGQTVQLYGWGATCTNQPEINCQSRYLKVANTRVTHRQRP